MTNPSSKKHATGNEIDDGVRILAVSLSPGSRFTQTVCEWTSCQMIWICTSISVLVSMWYVRCLND